MKFLWGLFRVSGLGIKLNLCGVNLREASDSDKECQMASITNFIASFFGRNKLKFFENLFSTIRVLCNKVFYCRSINIVNANVIKSPTA